MVSSLDIKSIKRKKMFHIYISNYLFTPLIWHYDDLITFFQLYYSVGDDWAKSIDTKACIPVKREMVIQ